MSDDITHDLDLLDDWLAGKGYGEEAGLVLRALSLIHNQAREIEKLRAALKPFADAVNGKTKSLDDDYYWPDCFTMGDLRTAAAALKETGNGS